MKRSAIFQWVKLSAFVLARGFLGLVLGLALWSVLPIAINWQPTVVMSGSMEPNIKTGDILVASPLSQSQIDSGIIKTGHVLLAHDPATPGTLYTHRVVRIMNDGTYMTKGDANAGPDKAMLSKEDIIGLERLRIPFLGIPIQEMRQGNFVPAILFVFLMTSSGLLVQADRKRHKELEAIKCKSEAQQEGSTNGLPKITTVILIAGVTVGSFSVQEASYEHSEAFFSGYTSPPASKFKTSDSFPLIDLGGILGR